MKHDVPKAIEWELEIVIAGFGKPREDGCQTLSETLESAVQWDVTLELRLEQTGQIEILFEKTFPIQKEAEKCFALLEEMFPHASHNILPD